MLQVPFTNEGLFVCLSVVLCPAQEFFTYMYMETSPLLVKGLQNLGLCSAVMTFEQRGIFIVPHLL
jgi:hypothetical protein